MKSGEITGHTLTGKGITMAWRDGLITKITPNGRASEGGLILPGLTDLQINGFAEVDFQQDKVTGEAVLAAARGLRRSGCTKFLLTLITDEWEKILQRVRWYRALRDKLPELQDAILGWHIEGPFLSDAPGFCGAHNPKLMVDPSPRMIEDLRAAAGEDAVLLTIAPERKNAFLAIQRAAELGIIVSLGHTNASAETLERAITAGARGFTHLGNGCPQTLDRHDNILWRVFERTDLMVSLIPDRIHVSPGLFRLAHQILPPPNIYYTTDAMSAAGAGPGRYRLAGLELEVGEDQIVRLPGKPNFAGSALEPFDAIVRAAEMLKQSWQSVWRRYSVHPLQLLGQRIPIFREGMPATFCRLREGHNKTLEVMYRGRLTDK